MAMTVFDGLMRCLHMQIIPFRKERDYFASGIFFQRLIFGPSRCLHYRGTFSPSERRRL